MVTVELEPCTTSAGQVRHLSANLASRHGPGLHGHALCDDGGTVALYDQEAYDAERLTRIPELRPEQGDITSLPLCKRCERIGQCEEDR